MFDPSQQQQALPKLRSELDLIKGAPAVTGEATWLIQDPLQNRFIQIDLPTYEVFSLWADCNTASELLAQVRGRGNVDIDESDITTLIEFAIRNKLTDQTESGSWKAHLQEQNNRLRSPLEWAAHNYIFFRIPLWQPQKFLNRTLSIARFFGRRQVHLVLVVMAALGLYLTSRQWEAFTSTFQHVFTWEGAGLVGVALIFVKIAHEMGHAYCAAHYGCRVPSMGISFMLMAPLLYTDVTDAWRLTDRRQRLVIAAGGILVELGIAAIALFAWSFMPDGPVRSVTFILAVVSFATSLLVNLNPLMRFDGYYLLSDWLGIENLQPRSFEMARWKLREWLFGFGIPCPEHLSRRHHRIMIAYGWAVWFYRLALFIGIALIVYHFFFKVLGIALFLFEIIFFIARPIWSELKIWYQLRASIRTSRRTGLTVAALLAIVLFACIPWSSRVEIPAVLEPRNLANVYPAKPARIAAVHVQHGQSVVAGDPLVTFVSPDIEKNIDIATTKLRLLRMQHARRIADATDREATLELESTIVSLNAQIDGLKKEQDEFVSRAPISGKVVEFSSDLHVGRWVSATHMIAIIASPEALVVRGYVSESDLWRIKSGSHGRFVPEAIQRPTVDIVVENLSIAGAPSIDIQDLSSAHGGRVAVQVEQSGTLPISAQYLIRMSTKDRTAAPELINRGIAVINGERESIMARVWKNSMAVLLRETGF